MFFKEYQKAKRILRLPGVQSDTVPISTFIKFLQSKLASYKKFVKRDFVKTCTKPFTGHLNLSITKQHLFLAKLFRQFGLKSKL